MIPNGNDAEFNRTQGSIRKRRVEMITEELRQAGSLRPEARSQRSNTMQH